MLIGIIADSHENMPMIAKAVQIFNEKNVDTVLHAGDVISPITFNEFKNLKARFFGVFGNNDGEKKMLNAKFSEIGAFYDRYYMMDTKGQKVLLMHEPALIDTLIASQKYDVIIYGHTHDVDIRTEGKTLVINPGECGGWLTGKSHVVILELPSKKTEVIELK